MNARLTLKAFNPIIHKVCGFRFMRALRLSNVRDYHICPFYPLILPFFLTIYHQFKLDFWSFSGGIKLKHTKTTITLPLQMDGNVSGWVGDIFSGPGLVEE